MALPQDLRLREGFELQLWYSPQKDSFKAN